MSDLLFVVIISSVIFMILAHIIEMGLRLQMLLFTIHFVLYQFSFGVLIKMIDLLGIWNFYLVSSLVCISIYSIFNPISFEKENHNNLAHNSRKYNIKIVKFCLDDHEHHTKNHFEPLSFNKDGTISRYKKTETLMEEIIEIIKEVKDNNQLQMIISRVGNPSGLYQRFHIFLYTITELGTNSFDAINNLSLKYNRISRINLSEKNLVKCVYYNKNANQIMIEPSKISKLIEDKGFELGNYEFYLFTELINELNRDKIPNSILNGDYSVGMDIYQVPVRIDQPSSTLYLGGEDKIPQIMDFEYNEDCALITDDPNTIDSVIINNPEVRLYKIDDLSINIVDMFRDEPKFFRKLLSLFEEIIPDSIKSAPKYKQIAGQLIEFLELKQLLDPQFSVHTGDLLSSKTYTKYSQDLSINIETKYKEIFMLSIFNEDGDSLLSLLDAPGKKIISLQGLNDRSKIAVIIMLLLIKDQCIVDNQLIISAPDINLENHMAKLTRELDIYHTLIHLRGLNKISNWIVRFDLVLRDAGTTNPALKRIFEGLPNVNRGISMSYEFRDRTILEVIS